MNVTMATLLGVTTGRLMGDMGDLYRFYEAYTGSPVFTHQLPRLFHQTHQTIIAQYPFIRKVDLSEIDRDNYKVVLSNLVAEHGDSFDVARPLLTKHLVKEPISELVDKVGADKVTVVTR